MLRGSWVLVAGMLLAGSACAHRRSAVQPNDTPVHLTITNHYVLPVEVSVTGNGIEHRLGTVHPGMTSRFVVPQFMIGNGMVEFVAAPGGGVDPIHSGELLIAPGDVVEFEIATHLRNSTARVVR